MTTATIDKPREPEITYGYFGHIAKFDKLEDGTLMVYGKAVGPEVDLDEQICDPTWLKTAMPEWYEWGNVREQHGNIASGVGVEMIEGEDGGWWLKTHVVDPGTVKKVETRVLKGYSVGISNGAVIRDKAARGGRINRGKIHEISLVDRPANAACSISIAKSADGVKFFPVDVEESEPQALKMAVPPGPEPESAALGDLLSIIDDPTGPGLTPETLEKTVSWYREALRVVEDAYAGKWTPAPALITKDAGSEEHEADHADIAGAQAAIDQILDLIISEAGQAKGGRFKELRDIEVLLSAARSLCHFVECEQGEDGDEYDTDTMMAYKAAGWTTADEIARQEIGEPATVVPDTTDLITKAVQAAQAEFRTAHEAELATLRADLEKALAAPIAGGPVTFKHVKPTSSAPAQAPTESDATYWRALAETPGLGIEVQRAYRAKAASLSQGAST